MVQGSKKHNIVLINGSPVISKSKALGWQFCWKNWSQGTCPKVVFPYGAHLFFLRLHAYLHGRGLADEDYGGNQRLFTKHCCVKCRGLFQTLFLISMIGKSKEYRF